MTELKTLEINFEKGIFKVNGTQYEKVSFLNLFYEFGRVSLTIGVDMTFESNKGFSKFKCDIS